MIHDPLLRIAKLQQKAKQGVQVSVEEWQSVWNDMNCAVCFFLRLKERGAFKKHERIAGEIELFLSSKDEVRKA